MSEEKNKPAYVRIYVWELPIRLVHWASAACILTLVATGLLIAYPMTLFNAEEAYQQYWFGTVRFLHFTAAYLLLLLFLIRVYWGFVGNQYARWGNMIPHTRQQFAKIIQVIKVDILQIRLKGAISLGHNMLACAAYVFFFLAIIFQVVSGFALYDSMSDSWFASGFAWLVPLMGGDMIVRQWHHLATWFFIVFILIHVYLVLFHDYVEGRGTTSAMIGGWKFEHRHDLR
jgi:Ni/Fe-hydrogenase 1 B-type cytochrome subunit